MTDVGYPQHVCEAIRLMCDVVQDNPLQLIALRKPAATLAERLDCSLPMLRAGIEKKITLTHPETAVALLIVGAVAEAGIEGRKLSADTALMKACEVIAEGITKELREAGDAE